MTNSEKPKGEYVVPRKAVEYYGARFIEAIRWWMSPKEFLEELRKKEAKR